METKQKDIKSKNNCMKLKKLNSLFSLPTSVNVSETVAIEFVAEQ